MIWHKGKVITFEKAKKHIHDDSLIEGILKYYAGDEKGYEDHDIRISIGRDGSLSLSDYDVDSGFIYLYPEQVELLKKLLKDTE
jgi:hypothetical protein